MGTASPAGSGRVDRPPIAGRRRESGGSPSLRLRAGGASFCHRRIGSGKVPEPDRPRFRSLSRGKRTTGVPMTQIDKTVHYDGPSGGWGSVRGMARIYGAEIDSPAVALVSDADDGVHRQVGGQAGGLTVTPFDLPGGCVAAYDPEMNPLVPLWYHDQQSKTPAVKAVPVRIEA